MKITNNFIPHHDCKNCGECCGPVPINEKEYKEISKYVVVNKPKYNKENDVLECKFRVENNCSIYTVRPTLCRIMGVVKGMECSHGNSKNLDGTKFIDFNLRMIGVINSVIKTDY